MCDATFVVGLLLRRGACSGKPAAAVATLCREGNADAIFASPAFRAMINMEMRGGLRTVTLVVVHTNASVGGPPVQARTGLTSKVAQASASAARHARNAGGLQGHAVSPSFFLQLLCAPLMLLLLVGRCGSRAKSEEAQQLAVTSPAERAALYMMQHARVQQLQQLQMVASSTRQYSDTLVNGDPHNRQNAQENEF